jgi:myo-inositol-1(or 4)-monophosphatase
MDDLLELCKDIASKTGARLLDSFNQDYKKYVHSDTHPKEIKALADSVMERAILPALIAKGIPILSEESGNVPSETNSKYWFIVDPLDGTFNFVKGLGPSAVSIALWEDRKPIFGVIYNILERQLVWGGCSIGSYCDGQRISVSHTAMQAEASICTGFPVRFDLADDVVMQDFCRMVRPYAKVRMLGSAAVSLLNVARGSADVYFERDIMLWDVAAGLAIVEGAGGATRFVPATAEYALNVFASNGVLPPFQ